MKIIIVLLVIVFVAWFLNLQSEQNDYSLIRAVGTKFSSTAEPMKCTTKSGKVLYGSLPPSIQCDKLEAVNIEESLTFYKGDGLAEDKLDVVASLKPEKFMCDGRTNCSQMTSCAEAIFFLKNCPNTIMDGDYDGTPCEQQWCS